MNDKDLKLLGELQAPDVRAEARETAVLAAMDAYDKASEQQKTAATQGIGTGDRPTSILNQIWSMMMNSVLKPAWNMKPATMAAVTGRFEY